VSVRKVCDVCNMHRQRTVDRDALAAEFPESRKAIMAVNRTATPGGARAPMR
jgi:hypothetical protein